MASFDSWMLPHKRRWRRIIAGYQDLYNDSGNWANYKIGVGELIGTNRSIAAQTLIDWRGKMVTKQEMMNLSIEEAKQIYKVKYWDKINGDKINSQAIADLLADMKSSAGGNGVKQLQKTIVALGENISVDGNFGTQSVEALNRLIRKVGEARIFNSFRDNMIQYYEGINSQFVNQWVSSLNKDYPPMEESWYSPNGIKVALVVVAVLLATYAVYQYRQIQKKA